MKIEAAKIDAALDAILEHNSIYANASFPFTSRVRTFAVSAEPKVLSEFELVLAMTLADASHSDDDTVDSVVLLAYYNDIIDERQEVRTISGTTYAYTRWTIEGELRDRD